MADENAPKFPQTFQTHDFQMVTFLGELPAPPSSTDWIEVAEYKLVRIRRVRYQKQWEDET
jgi:hypothetical protein